MAVITSRVVRIGNSRGIRIPKLLLDQLKFGEEVELSVEQDHLIVRPVGRTRDGWDAQFKLMAERGDDRLLDEGALNLSRWDAEEWEWS
jgi:antitoxin MazE